MTESTIFHGFGKLTPLEMAVPMGVGVILPDINIVNRFPSYHGIRAQEIMRYNLAKGKLEITDPPTRRVYPPFYRDPIEVYLQGDVPFNLSGLEQFNYVMAELSFLEGFIDLLQPSAIALTYAIINKHAIALEGEALHHLPQTIRKTYIQEVINTKISPALIDKTCILKADLPETLEIMSELFAKMIAGDHSMAPKIMQYNPMGVILAGTYATSAIISGNQDMLFQNGSEMKIFLISFAKAEIPIVYGGAAYDTIRSKFSTTLITLQDAILTSQAPLIFALANKATLEKLGLTHANYLKRIRITRSNIDINLEGMPWLRDEKIKEMLSIIIAPKSIYSALSLALNPHDNSLASFIKQELTNLAHHYNIPLPETSQPQLALDYDYALIINSLVEQCLSDKDPRLSLFLNIIYTHLQQTSDLIRATAYTPLIEKFFNLLLQQAFESNSIKIKLICNYHDHQGSHPQVWDLKDPSIQAMFASLSTTEPKYFDWQGVINAWYEKYAQFTPYAAIHLYGKTPLPHTLYHTNIESNISQSLMEVVLCPLDKRREREASRQFYKMWNSKPVNA